jgi:formate--tetrahydrofolate ligase
LRKKTPVGRADTLGTFYFDRVFPMGVEAMLETVDPVKAGKAPRIEQDDSKATYEGRCGPDNAKIHWGKPREQIDRVIRGCNPASGVWATLDCKQLKIFDAKPLPAKDPKGIVGKLGEIVAAEADGFTLACADGRFKITCVQPADSTKINAGESAGPQRKEQAASQHTDPKSDIEIAQAAKMRPIMDVASERLGIGPENLEPYGHYKAKVSMNYIKSLQSRPNGKLILVSAITPTPAGEGKTTTTVGLTDALNKIGKKAMLCIREPSLGPCFGVKGGAAGGGYAQVVPMEDINLHFTGDLHAIGSANNLLAALIDNHIYWGNALGIDARRITWRRAIDMNERSLRHIVSSLGGVGNGFPREDGFDITVASEVMAIFCLAKDLDDLKKRLSHIVIGYTRDRKPVRAGDLKGHGPMTALLKEALAPNLVQTLEGTPAFIHGGPFANIAHGCNSVLATTTALKLADYVVTECGFGADLGGEKFLDIKCRKTGLAPDCVVLVATIRALKMHGGVKKDDLKKEDLKALSAGMANLQRHIENMKKFGIVPVVSINRFSADTEAEIALVKEACGKLDVEALMADHWAMGGEGAADVARAVVKVVESGKSKLNFLYPDEMPLLEKTRTIAKEIYRAKELEASKAVRDQLANFESMGYGKLPVCMAKTQYSFSTNADAKGAPTDFIISVRDVRLSAGAEFVVAICGEIMTMPGLPRVPAADSIDVGPDGRIVGLF